MAIPKILDFSAGSKFAIKLSQDIRYDRESQNCDRVLFSVTPLLNLADGLTEPALQSVQSSDTHTNFRTLHTPRTPCWLK